MKPGIRICVAVTLVASMACSKADRADSQETTPPRNKTRLVQKAATNKTATNKTATNKTATNKTTTNKTTTNKATLNKATLNKATLNKATLNKTTTNKTTTNKTPPAFPTAKQAKVPALPTAIVKATSKHGLVTMARLLLPHTTVADGVAVAFQWQDPKHVLPPARARNQLTWRETLDGLVVKVKPPGKNWRILKVGISTVAPTVGLVPAGMLRVAHFDNKGIHYWGQLWPWKASSPILASPGTYKFKIRGTLGLKTKPLTFETGVLTVQIKVATAAFQPIAQLRRVGMAHAKTKSLKGANKPPGFDTMVIEDSGGNRVLRFYLSTLRHRYRNTVVEMVITPAGKIMSSDSLRYFTCVASGTNIETESGPKAIETVRIGDRVWSFDLETRKRRLTTVTANARHMTNGLIQIGATLRTTATHPIYVDGAWVLAGDLGSATNVMTSTLEVARLPVRRITTTAVVYDLSVESPHNFFADNLLVHNKTAMANWRDGKQWKLWLRAGDQLGANK